MRRIPAIALAFAAALSAPAWAQKPADDHSAHHGAAKAQAAPLAEGEVRKVDKAAKKITLKHGPIPNIDMPAMTMVFPVKDPALLDKAKPGQKVNFQAEMIGGEATVTQLEPVK
ncbi:MAG TPA: copper-binding protein [Burkholderiales bacterium]